MPEKANASGCFLSVLGARLGVAVSSFVADRVAGALVLAVCKVPHPPHNRGFHSVPEAAVWGTIRIFLSAL